jgi:hypothetical protein
MTHLIGFMAIPIRVKVYGIVYGNAGEDFWDGVPPALLFFGRRDDADLAGDAAAEGFLQC